MRWNLPGGRWWWCIGTIRMFSCVELSRWRRRCVDFIIVVLRNGDDLFFTSLTCTCEMSSDPNSEIRQCRIVGRISKATFELLFFSQWSEISNFGERNDDFNEVVDIISPRHLSRHCVFVIVSFVMYYVHASVTLRSTQMAIFALIKIHSSNLITWFLYLCYIISEQRCEQPGQHRVESQTQIVSINKLGHLRVAR